MKMSVTEEISKLVWAWSSSWGLLTLLLILSMLYFTREDHKAKIFNKIPGPKTVPVFGNALMVNLPAHELVWKVYSISSEFMHVGLIRFWMAYRKILFIFSADAAQDLLGSQKHLDKSHEYIYLHSWLGTGLLTSTDFHAVMAKKQFQIPNEVNRNFYLEFEQELVGNLDAMKCDDSEFLTAHKSTKWQSRRKLLTPAFHFKILENFIKVFNQQSVKLISKLSSKATGKSFDILPYITHCALDIIHETALGVPINSQDCSDSEYIKAVYRLGELVSLRQSKPWFQIDFIYYLSGLSKDEKNCLEILHKQSYKIIKERREKLKSSSVNVDLLADDTGSRKKVAFLDLLLSCTENDQPLSDQDIREEVDTFMFEGHDTTAAAMVFCIYLLGCHQDKQAIVFEELNNIFGDDDREPTMDDIREMKYLECCIKEALRLYPSVPGIARHITENTFIGGYEIPAGTSAAVFPFVLHRNPKYFPEPHKFKPERFEAENSLTRHPYSYIPFSAGPRNCIGQKFALIEEKVMISYIFRHFEVLTSSDQEQLELRPELVLRPHNGIFVELLPRKI